MHSEVRPDMLSWTCSQIWVPRNEVNDSFKLWPMPVFFNSKCLVLAIISTSSLFIVHHLQKPSEYAKSQTNSWTSKQKNPIKVSEKLPVLIYITVAGTDQYISTDSTVLSMELVTRLLKEISHSTDTNMDHSQESTWHRAICVKCTQCSIATQENFSC